MPNGILIFCQPNENKYISNDFSVLQEKAIKMDDPLKLEFGAISVVKIMICHNCHSQLKPRSYKVMSDLIFLNIFAPIPDGKLFIMTTL